MADLSDKEIENLRATKVATKQLLDALETWTKGFMPTDGIGLTNVFKVVNKARETSGPVAEAWARLKVLVNE
jgi:hypothetical protein